MVVFYLLCTFPYCDICLLDISPQYILQPPTAVTWRDFVFNSDIFLRSWEILVCIYFVLSHQELVRFSFLEKKNHILVVQSECLLGGATLTSATFTWSSLAPLKSTAEDLGK